MCEQAGHSAIVCGCAYWWSECAAYYCCEKGASLKKWQERSGGFQKLLAKNYWLSGNKITSNPSESQP